MIKDFFAQIKILPRDIWCVTAANMLLAISTTMTFAVSPLFMTSVLGITVLSIGTIEGFAEALSQISKLFSGAVTDYKGRKKPTFLVGVFMAALAKPFFILAGGTGSVIVSKILERVSNGVISTPRDAYVADIAGPKNRGGSFGMVMAGRTLGCVIGPFLVSFLMIWIQDYRALLWLGFIPVVIAFFLIWYYMREKSDSIINVSTSPQNTQKKHTLSWADIRRLPSNYWSLLLTASLFMFARFNDGLLALRLQELGAPTFICIATIGIFNAISLICSYPAGVLSDKWGRSQLLYFSYISLILCNICFIWADDMYVGLLGVVFWGAQRGTSQILFTAMIADEAPPHLMGTSMGLFNISVGVMALLAGSIAGWIGNTSLKGAFVFGLVVSCVATVSLIIRNHLASKKITHNPRHKNDNPERHTAAA